MMPWGEGKKGILLLMEPPTEDECRKQEPWLGRTGRMVRQIFKENGISVLEDCITIPVVCCPSNEANQYELACCRKNVLKTIQEFKPKLIISFGAAGIISLLEYRWQQDLGGTPYAMMTKWRGWQIPDQDLKAWWCPVFSPSFVGDGGHEVGVIWENDIKNALAHLDVPLRVYKSEIKEITDLSILDELDVPEVAIDYETTGLKPHDVGHRIICVSVAVSEELVYVFMMPKTKQERAPYLRLLANEKIGKIAQNMKFEEAWSVVRLRQPVANWVWDTMQATHVLTNRYGVTGLKFQTYVQFGVVDYSSDVSPWLKGVDEKNSNALNKIEELVATESGKKKLLTYCGYDGLYEFRLANLQRKLMEAF